MVYASPRSWQRVNGRGDTDPGALHRSYVTRPDQSRYQANRPDAFPSGTTQQRYDVLVLISRFMKPPCSPGTPAVSRRTTVGSLVRRWSLRHADVYSVSSKRKRPCSRRGSRVAPERSGCCSLRSTPPPVPPRDDAIRETDLNPSRRYVIFVGRLETLRGSDHFFRSPTVLT